jgi:Ca2+-binding RTX toxin-like protein
MATYLLNAGTLEQLLANTHLSGGTVNAIDYALFESGLYPSGKQPLAAQVNNGSGMETVSVANSTGLFIELGSNVHDTITFSADSGHGHDHGHDHGHGQGRDHGGSDRSGGGRFDRDDRRHGHDTLASSHHPGGGSNSGHVLVAGDGNNVSIFDKGAGHDTLIAGYQDTLSVHQTLSVQSGDNMLVGGLYGNVYDTLNAGSGNDTLQVYSGHNVLNAGGGHDTLFGGSGSDTMNLGGKGSHDLVNSGSGAETINIATGGSDTINGYSQGQTQVYIDSDGKSVDVTSHGKYDVYSYGHGQSTTTVDVMHGSATVHIIS